MRILQFPVTKKCNSRCAFCEIDDRLRKLPDEGIEALERRLDEAAKGYEAVGFTGGEPAIYPGIFRLIQHAARKGFRDIRIETNGFIFSYWDFARKIKKAGAKAVQATFQTTDKGDYDIITGVENSLELFSKGIGNIRDSGMALHINIVANKLNYRRLPEMVEFLIEKRADSVQISMLNPTNLEEEGKKKTAASLKQMVPYIKKALETADKKGFSEIFLNSFPLCIMQKIRPQATEDIFRHEKNRQKQHFQDSLKAKPGICNECAAKGECSGIWKEHYAIFGTEGLEPLKENRIESLHLAEDYNFPKAFRKATLFYAAFLSDIEGLACGFKPVSVFEAEKSEYLLVKEVLNTVGIKTSELASFSQQPNNRRSFAASMDAAALSRIKRLLEDEARSEGRKREQATKEIGKLLGYPKCCAEAYARAYERLLKPGKMKAPFEDIDSEERARAEAMMKSRTFKAELNNLNSCIPQMYGFVPCSYFCNNATSYVRRAEGCLRKKGIRTEKIGSRRRLPMLYISKHECVVFSMAAPEGGRIRYAGIECSSASDGLNKLIEKGDSLGIERDSIRVYNGNAEAGSYNIIKQITKGCRPAVIFPE